MKQRRIRTPELLVGFDCALPCASALRHYGRLSLATSHCGPAKVARDLASDFEASSSITLNHATSYSFEKARQVGELRLQPGLLVLDLPG